MRSLFPALFAFCVGCWAYAQAPPVDEYDLLRDLADQGKWDQALPLALKLTKENPNYAFNWMVLGWTHRFTGKHADAIPAFERALKLGALRPDRIYFEMALSEAGKGDKAKTL